MANTYTLIEKIVVGAAGATSVTFTSIPQTYTDLKIVCMGRANDSGVADGFGIISFNGITTGFSSKQIQGSGSAVTSASPNYRNAGIVGTAATANTFSSVEFYIPNYTSSNNKSYSVESVTENNATEAYAGFAAGLWSNTAAITSVTLADDTKTIFQYSSFYLYGIAKEGVSPGTSSAPYATGGDSIVFDGTYWIHTFTSSGTFTPKKALSNVDYLVVAGGGAADISGGSGGRSAGGGAGGLRSTVTATGGGGSLESKVSFANGTAYTITVGAGGSMNSSGNNSSITGTGFTTITSTGGGKGGTYGVNGSNGGSGGGGGSTGSGTTNGGTGTANQGYNGGSSNQDFAGGGGGGAGAAGSSPTGTGTGANGGVGGNGVAVAISGSSVTYAGGGGGYGNNSGGAGGSGGGGTGGTGGGNSTAGTANLGGGGGGCSGVSTGTGGSGIVIVRYPV